MKLKDQFYKLNISKKLLLILFIAFILPVIFMQLVSYTATAKTMKEQINQLATMNLKQSGSSFEALLNNYNNVLLDLYTNDAIAENLMYVNTWDGQRYFPAINIIHEQLKNIIFSKDDIYGAAIVALNGETVYYDKVTQSSVDSFCIDINNIRSTALYQKAIKTSEIVYGNTQTIRSDVYGTKHIFYIAKRLVDLRNLKQGAIGTVILSIDEDSIQKSYLQDEKNRVNSTFITDKEGNVISFPSKQYVGENIYHFSGEEKDFSAAIHQFIQSTSLIDSKKLMINNLPVEKGEFIVTSVQDEEYALHDVNHISVLIIVISLCTIALASAIIFSLSKNTSYSVKKIINAMNQANQGNLQVQIDFLGADEFAQISYNFNNMIIDMKKLIDKNQEAMLRKNKAEIRALEAQINPHFLYNTLDAINWMAIEKEEYTISRMLKNLAIILRYSINNSNEIVALSEELEYLKNYIYLQKERFNYSFECILLVPDDVMSCKIHKLLIQPMVENTLVHAFPGKTGHDKIEIMISREENNCLTIQIRDNGIGMDKNLIETFNHYNYEEDSMESSIGIRNVISRIKMYYGDKGGLVISPGEESGTCICIRIPYQE